MIFNVWRHQLSRRHNAVETTPFSGCYDILVNDEKDGGEQLKTSHNSPKKKETMSCKKKKLFFCKIVTWPYC